MNKLVLVLFEVLLFALTSCGQPDSKLPLKWQMLESSAPSGLTETLRREILPEWRGSLGRMTVAAIQGQTQYVLYLVSSKILPPEGLVGVDTTLTPLCGTQGCRYIGYVKTEGKYLKVFDYYLHDRLPPNGEFIHVERDAPYPSLTIREYATTLD